MHEPITDQITTSTVLAGLAALLTTVFGWLGRRLINRVDSLEKNNVDRDEYNQTIQSLRDEIRNGHTETQRLIIDLYKTHNHGNNR